MAPPDNRTAIGEAKRLCFFAHYNAGATVGDHVLVYLDALVAAGFVIVLVSTSPLPPDDMAKLQSRCAAVRVRANVGHDFGGWIECCTDYFPISADYLLLTNDSVYAPVGDFQAFLRKLTAEPADFYGAVESGERGRHLQSWFLLFRPAAYRSAAFESLMLEPMPPALAKSDLIERYEVGLTRRLVEAGLRYRTAFSPLRTGGLAAARPYNAMHLLWDEVLRAGVPFLKVELLRFNAVRAMRAAAWRPVVTRLAPGLTPLIERDLAVRGRQPAPSWRALTRSPSITWPEVRAIVRLDHRRPRRWPVYLFAYRATVAVTRIIRRWLQERPA